MTQPNPDPSTLLVAARVCDRCLLGSKPLVSGERVAEILATCAETGQAFYCHRGTIANEPIVCRSFYERELSLVVRLAKILDRARFVTPGDA